MSQLYVVRETFKAGGKLFLAGSLLEDLSGIKLAKVKLNEKRIVEVPSDEKQLESLCYWLKTRAHTDLRAKLEEHASKGSDSAETTESNASAILPTPGTPVVKLPPKPLTGRVQQPQKLPVKPATGGTPLKK